MLVDTTQYYIIYLYRCISLMDDYESVIIYNLFTYMPIIVQTLDSSLVLLYNVLIIALIAIMNNDEFKKKVQKANCFKGQIKMSK